MPNSIGIIKCIAIIISLKQSEQEAVRIAEKLQGSVQLLEEHIAMLQGDAQSWREAHGRELERERLDGVQALGKHDNYVGCTVMAGEGEAPVI